MWVIKNLLSHHLGGRGEGRAGGDWERATANTQQVSSGRMVVKFTVVSLAQRRPSAVNCLRPEEEGCGGGGS